MKYLILHGSFGSPNSNWFPWLKKELEFQDKDVLAPQMPVDKYEEAEKIYNSTEHWKAKYQNLDNWFKKFETDIQPWIGDENLTIFAHSISPVFVLHLIEKYNLNIDTAVFVSPFYERIDLTGPYDIVNDSFYHSDFNWEKIKNNITNRYVFYGDKDRYVTLKYAQNFIDKTDSKATLMKGYGHLGGELSEFPEILNLIK